MEAIPFKVRTMERKDLPQVLDLPKEMVWQMCTQSIYSWYECDPDGFKVAVTDSGEILGICCAVRITEDFHFVGFYIAKNKYRGMGIGFKVWTACMEYIGHRNAMLNAVPEMADKYQTKGGFPFVQPDCLLQKYKTHNEIHPENLSDKVPAGISILPFDESLLPSMHKFDHKMSGYNRQRAIELSCKEKDTKTLVALKGDVCVGYATIKSDILGIPYVGPMYADDADIAEVMLRELLLSFSLKNGLFMVTFAAHEAANNLMKKIGCPKYEQLFRMYKSCETGTDFKRSMNKVYAHFNTDFSPF